MTIWQLEQFKKVEYDDPVNRNRLLAVGAVFTLLLVITVVWAARARGSQPSASQRTLVAPLGYCNADDVRPCILAFSLDTDNNMLVSLRVPDRLYPNFYLTITRAGEVHRYECEEVSGSATLRTCTGTSLFPGEPLQFSLIAIGNDHVLAAGNFAIIGLLLFTPEVETTATLSTLEPPADTAAPDATQPPIFVIPTPTPRPSYPNPSSPSPSYPNP